MTDNSRMINFPRGEDYSSTQTDRSDNTDLARDGRILVFSSDGGDTDVGEVVPQQVKPNFQKRARIIHLSPDGTTRESRIRDMEGTADAAEQTLLMLGNLLNGLNEERTEKLNTDFPDLLNYISGAFAETSNDHTDLDLSADLEKLAKEFPDIARGFRELINGTEG